MRFLFKAYIDEVFIGIAGELEPVVKKESACVAMAMNRSKDDVVIRKVRV